MNEEITIEHNGVTVTAEYSVIGDTLQFIYQIMKCAQLSYAV